MTAALTRLGVALAAAGASFVSAAPPAPPLGADQAVAAVRTYAETVLREARDVYGPQRTPLFVDGLNVETREPARWRYQGQTWILSNLASQQNLFRTLDGLSAMTGDSTYHRAATEVMRYAFDHLASPAGLLYWGGHCAYDAATEGIVGEIHDKAHGGRYDHELKRHYPYYEFMWSLDSEATARLIEAFWNAHILDWSNLEMNRHGAFDVPMGSLWASRYEGGPVFFPARGLSFVNTGSDLFYAAAMLHKLRGDPEPLVWAKRMAHRYVETRNAATGLGGYQYTQSADGDRARKQFGPEFGDLALEGKLLTPELGLRKFAMAGLCQLMLGEMLGEAGREFRQWGLEDLAAYANWAYDPQNNTFCALFTDGTKLTPADVKRKGYFGPVNSPAFKPREACPLFFRAYAMAFRLSRDPRHWEMARHIARGNGLGDIGEMPGAECRLDSMTTCSDPQALLGLLDLFRASQRQPYLDLAGRVAANILRGRFRRGLFVSGADQVYAKLDAVEPLALLHLAATLEGRPERVPQVWPGQSFFHCPMDGYGRTYDNEVFYAQGQE